jgi:hypothetical protein
MKRRRFARIVVAGAAWFALSAHTPYGHWKIYRRKHLLIGSSRTDPTSYALAETIAATLVRHLPESSARASRAPDLGRIASLLASDQWQVSVLRRQDAADLAAGRGQFESVGAVPLRSLFAMGDHLLVCRVDFPDRHAWLVAATLTESAGEIPGGTPAGPEFKEIALHPGARAYAEGVPLPPVTEGARSGAEPDHGHPR